MENPISDFQKIMGTVFACISGFFALLALLLAYSPAFTI